MSNHKIWARTELSFKDNVNEKGATNGISPDRRYIGVNT